MHVVLIAGDRNWTDEGPIRALLVDLKAEYGLDLLVVCGGARGVDTIVATVCTELGIDLVVVPANWVGRPKYAGPYRNKLMLDLLPVDEVIAVHRWLPKSKGTKDLVQRAEKRGIPVRVIGDRSGTYTGLSPLII